MTWTRPVAVTLSFYADGHIMKDYAPIVSCSRSTTDAPADDASYCDKGKNMLRRLSLFLLLLLVCIPFSWSMGPPDYLPNGAHPRIWLTPDVVDAVDQKRLNSSSDWSALLAWCDSNLGTAGYDLKNYQWPGGGYRGSGYAEYILNYAFAYQALKNADPVRAARYADYARAVMSGMVRGFSVGEEINGIGMIRAGENNDFTINAAEATLTGVPRTQAKNGYAARYFGVAMAVGYDWLYEKMTVEERKLYAGILYRFIDWYEGRRSAYNNGVLIGGTRYVEDRDATYVFADGFSLNQTDAVLSGTKGYDYRKIGGNFFGGYFSFAALAAVAAYDEDAADPQRKADSLEYLQLARENLLKGVVIPAFSDPLRYQGGDTPEGWSYNGGYHNILRGILGMQTATGEPILGQGFAWPKDFLDAYLSSTAPNLRDMNVNGQWTGAYTGRPYEYILMPLGYVLRTFYPSDPEGSFAQEFLTRASFALSAEKWAGVMWKTDATPSIPLSLAPLSYRAAGTGLISMRSSWQDAPDSVFATVQLGGYKELDHEGYDEGTFFIQRGADRLFTHQNPAVDGVSFNTILFNDANHYGPSKTLTKPAVSAFKDAGEYLYVRADVSPAWAKNEPYYANIPRCLEFNRSFVFLRPNFFVIFDATRSNPQFGNAKDWLTQFEANPVVQTASRTISVVKGNSSAFIKTLYSGAGSYVDTGAYTKTNPATGFWRVKFEPSVAQEYDAFLHVIEVSDAKKTSMAETDRILSAEGSMIGACIHTETKDVIVMFGADKDGASVSGTVSYSVPRPSPKESEHFLFNMPPQTRYKVRAILGTNISVVPDAGGDLLSTQEGVLEIHIPPPPLNLQAN